MVINNILHSTLGKIQMTDAEKRKWSVSVFIVLLVHVAGGIGMAFFNRDFFLSLTHVNLILMFLLLVWNGAFTAKGTLLFFGIAVFVGIVTEIVGVNTGWLFGEYAYGDLLGPKLFGVPLLIGINWFCIVYCSLQLVVVVWPTAKEKMLLGAVLTAMIATIFDWVMEPVAMVLGYWHWENDHVPSYNYFCWYLISFFLSLIYFKMSESRHNGFALPLLLIQFLFFLFLRIMIV